MKIEASTPEQYIDKLPDERKEAMSKLRRTIIDNLPEGFKETMTYGMIGYVVPKSIYPEGYHADPEQPLPFISIASQKNHIALYHSGLYTNKALMEWFTREYPKYSSMRIDMGKSCIRFKKVDQIPYKLIEKLVARVGVHDWIKLYESVMKKNK